MAQAHIYVRQQVCGSDLQVAAIVDAVNGLKDAVEAAGGEWRGDVKFDFDGVPAGPAVVAEEEGADVS